MPSYLSQIFFVTGDLSQLPCKTTLCLLLQQRELLNQFKEEKRVPGMEFVGKRSYSYNIPLLPWEEREAKDQGLMIVEKRVPGMEFVGKRSPLSLISKRASGMEFVGKRSSDDGQMRKRVPGMEFVG